MSRLTDTKDVVVCWSGNCGDCIKCERDAEKARADTAERHANELELSNSRQGAEILRLQACCAEMRATLEHIAEYWNGAPERAAVDAAEEAEQSAKETLAKTDCGKGWMPPQELEALIDSIDNEWLDAIGRHYLKLTGKPWETRDGETASEGRKANVSALLQILEDEKAHNAALGRQHMDHCALIEGLKNHNKRLVEALQAIRDHRQLTVEPTAEGFQTIAREALAAETEKEKP